MSMIFFVRCSKMPEDRILPPVQEPPARQAADARQDLETGVHLLFVTSVVVQPIPRQAGPPEEEAQAPDKPRHGASVAGPFNQI